MKPKKSPKANLENKRGLFLQIGLIVALVACLAIFSQGGEKRNVMSDYFVSGVVDDFELPPVTDHQQKPPEVRAQVVPVVDLINIVGNDAQIDVGLTFPEFDPDAPIIVPEPVVETPVEDPDFIFNAEVMPEFQGGGLAEFRSWVQEKIKYPVPALENNIQGRVILSFIVDKDGRVTHIEVLQAPDNSLAQEAIRVVQNAPEWTPGQQGGRKVRVKFSLPLEFKIK